MNTVMVVKVGARPVATFQPRIANGLIHAFGMDQDRNAEKGFYLDVDDVRNLLWRHDNGAVIRVRPAIPKEHMIRFLALLYSAQRAREGIWVRWDREEVRVGA